MIGLTVFGEVFLSVIDDMVCPNGAQHVQFPRAIDASHFSPECFGELYRHGTYAPTGTVDQNMLSTLDTCLSKKMQRVEPPNVDGGRFFIGDIRWFCFYHP